MTLRSSNFSLPSRPAPLTGPVELPARSTAGVGLYCQASPSPAKMPQDASALRSRRSIFHPLCNRYAAKCSMFAAILEGNGRPGGPRCRACAQFPDFRLSELDAGLAPNSPTSNTAMDTPQNIPPTPKRRRKRAKLSPSWYASLRRLKHLLTWQDAQRQARIDLVKNMATTLGFRSALIRRSYGAEFRAIKLSPETLRVDLMVTPDGRLWIGLPIDEWQTLKPSPQREQEQELS